MLRFLPHLGRDSLVSEPAAALAPLEALSRLAQNPAELAEIRSLSEERDPELFHEGLINFAGRLQRRGRSAEAQAALEIVVGSTDVALAARARSRLQALQGVGDVGLRAEVLLSRFAHEATEPAALFAMGGAGAIYRFSRFALLGRLALAPASALTRGFGGRVLASSLAFSAEATSFPLLMRGGHAVRGRSQEWSTEILAREIASSFLVLGGLKLAGAGAVSLRRHLSPGNTATLLGPVLQQGSMLGGILAGHRMEEWAGLRAPAHDGATTMIDSLALLVQFNVAGRLSQGLFGEGVQRWERELDRRSQSLANPPRGMGSLPDFALTQPALAMAGGVGAPRGPEILMMQGGRDRSGGSPLARPSFSLPKMGLRLQSETSNLAERLNRQEAERVLRDLIPNGVHPENLQRPGFVETLLQAFGVTAHEFDVQAFRDGYEVACRHPERIGRLAFDFDEVYLHWTFTPKDLLTTMVQGAEAAYFHTPRSVLEYDPLPATEGLGLSRGERAWFEGTQRLFPMAFRQRLQFHPGARAFQLGLRLGQEQNLVMVTVGPPGRLMRIANEDPALKMIYFGRMPSDEISITDVRESPNIYTREDFTRALRTASHGELSFPGNVQVASYIETLRRHPRDGHRIKHPAIALLRGKRPFDALVDDSSLALKSLGSLPGFQVFQVPSARPRRTLNFSLTSPEAYLARSANGYVGALAERLLSDEWTSGPVENRPAPPEYPYQRLAIEIPWTKFGAGYVALGNESRVLGQDLAAGKGPRALPSAAPESPSVPLRLNEGQTRTLVERLYREFDILLDGRSGEVSIETGNTLMIKELATDSPEDFQASLDTYFTVEEQGQLPQASRPLAERGEKYFSQVASLMAAKTAVCNLLALDVAEHAREVRFRFGRPLLSGMAAHRLNGNSMLTTLSDDGEFGLGIALIEPSHWSSGLVGIGVEITTDRVRYTEPARHALAEAAFKATLPAQIQRQFNRHRTAELVADPAGNYSLTGPSMIAARHLRGDFGRQDALPIRTLSFQVGRATVGLAAIPALARGTHRPHFTPRPFNFPYRIDADGRYQLPRPGMTVAVLGDINSTRTLELVRKGNYVAHIERDPDMADLAQSMVEMFIRDEGIPIGRASDNSVVRADWYDSGTNADIVEAYFPLSLGDVPRRDQSGRMEALRGFLDQALNSKLVKGGSGFVISEVRPHIEDLAALIQADPNLELLEARYNATQHPLIGGFSATSNGRERAHYLVYRKKSGEPRE